MQRRTFSALATAVALGLAAPLTTQAQDKPPVRILVGFPPGGSVDIVARLLAERLRALLDQNIIVENKPGAAGRVALGDLRRAAPDGNTLVLAPSGALVILPWLYKNIGYDPAKDFSPVARVTTFDFAVTAGPGSPAGNIKAVMDWFKANPAKASYGTSGAGTVPHFAGLLLGQAAGVNMVHVPYKGGAPAAQDLIGGQIPLMVDTASETIEHHRAGRLRILAVTGESRSQALPDVPTLREGTRWPPRPKPRAPWSSASQAKWPRCWRSPRWSNAWPSWASRPAPARRRSWVNCWTAKSRAGAR